MLESIMSIENIMINVDVHTKDDIINKMVKLLDENGYIKDQEGFKKDIEKKEKLSTTAIGYGVAIPHAKSRYITEPVVSVAILRNGIDYRALDGQKVRIVFMIGIPEDEGDTHIRVLSKISKKLIHESFREFLLEASTPRAVYNLMKED